MSHQPQPAYPFNRLSALLDDREELGMQLSHYLAILDLALATGNPDDRQKRDLTEIMNTARSFNDQTGHPVIDRREFIDLQTKMRELLSAVAPGKTFDKLEAELNAEPVKPLESGRRKML